MKIIFVGLMAFLLIVTACSPATGPEAKLDELFNAAKKLDTEAIAKMVYDKSLNLEEELNEAFEITLHNTDDPLIDSLQDYFKEAAKLIKYKIENLEVDGEDAKITVKANYVDSSDYLQAVIVELVGLAMEEPDEDSFNNEETMGEIVKELKPKKLELGLENELTFRLVKEEEQWFFNEIDNSFIDVLTAGLITAINNLEF